MSLETNKQLVCTFHEAIGNKDYDALHKFGYEDFAFYPQKILLSQELKGE